MPEKLTGLKAIMEGEGRRQSWLSAKIGKDASEVSRYVNRGLIPDEPTQRAIAKALGRELAEVWPALYAEAAA